MDFFNFEIFYLYEYYREINCEFSFSRCRIQSGSMESVKYLKFCKLARISLNKWIHLIFFDSFFIFVLGIKIFHRNSLKNVSIEKMKFN